jgi:hypothetical protein
MSFLSFVLKIVKEIAKAEKLEQKEKEKRIKEERAEASKRKFSNKKIEKEEVSPFPFKNKYTLIEAKINPNSLEYYLTGNYKKKELVGSFIKNQVRIKELEEYLQKNRNRYTNRVSIIFGNNFDLSQITQKQKIEILKGFRVSNLRKQNCFFDFLNGFNKEDLIFLFELNLKLLNKYHWLIDDLGGINEFQNIWYEFDKHNLGEKCFIPSHIGNENLFRMLDVKGFVTHIGYPSTEDVINKLPFELIKSKLIQKNLFVKSREQASKKCTELGYCTEDLFNLDELKLLNGKYYRISMDFEILRI